MSVRPVGTTVLDILVPEADWLLADLRKGHDSGGGAGMPAHVTVLYPWRVFGADAARDDDIVVALKNFFAMRPAFELRFARSARFPDVLYLEPEPAAPVSALTRDVLQHWPEYRPYEGKHGDEPTPHLTLAHRAAAEVPDELASRVAGALPITTMVTSAAMHVFDGRQWRLMQQFPLGMAPDTAV